MRHSRTASERLKAYLDALPFSSRCTIRSSSHFMSMRPFARIRTACPTAGLIEQYAVWLREFPVVVSGTDQPYPLEQLPLIRAARGEAAHADDVAIQIPDGQVTIESWAVPAARRPGNITAIVSAFHDISQRRAVEIELARYRETLEQRVAQRTSELAALNTSLGARVSRTDGHQRGRPARGAHNRHGSDLGRGRTGPRPSIPGDAGQHQLV